MNVYVLQEEYWHDVDGTSTTLVDIYSVKEDALAKASEMNEQQGWQKAYSSMCFNVIEKELM